jgi:hypothetical protein
VVKKAVAPAMRKGSFFKSSAKDSLSSFTNLTVAVLRLTIMQR